MLPKKAQDNSTPFLSIYNNTFIFDNKVYNLTYTTNYTKH